MSKSFTIQILLLLWLLCQCDSACAQSSTVGYSALSSLVMSTADGLQVVHSRVVYVTPNASIPCPKNSDDSSCHTLSWYSHNDSEKLLANDTVVRLLKGVHTLNSTIYIENCKNLTIMGEAAHTTSLGDDKAQTLQPVTWINAPHQRQGLYLLTL